MRGTVNVICKVCGRVFCCAECRRRHEVKTHAIIVRRRAASLSESSVEGGVEDSSANSTGSVNSSMIYLFCPICERRPFALHEDVHSEMVEHIASTHLPLQCKKCAKVYSKIDDFKNFSKCLLPAGACSTTQHYRVPGHSQDAVALKAATTYNEGTTVHRSTISTQTSPMRRRLSDSNDSTPHLSTPISIINLRWKAKSKHTHEEFIGDSVSSIRNISSINNSSQRRSIDVLPGVVKGKVVRSTSTPVNAEVMRAKPKEQTFNVTGGQVSSIYGSGCESADYSPAMPINPASGCTVSPKQTGDSVNRYLKVGGGHTKMSAVTPLRHVMSKSIRKAFAEHGALPSARETVYNRIRMHDSVDVSSGPTSPSSEDNAAGSPLDLRLSPAIRRTRSDTSNDGSSRHFAQSAKNANGIPIRGEILLSSQKLTTESIVITRTQHLVCAKATCDSSDRRVTNSTYNSSANGSDSVSSSNSSSSCSVYKTCRSVEIITARTALSEVNIATAEAGDELRALQPLMQVHRHGLLGGVNSLAPVTPITRIPGSCINKKLIKFETPNMEAEKEQSHNSSGTNGSPGDVFFTPNATPSRKASVSAVSMANETTVHGSGSDDVRKRVVPRKLNNGFSPMRRPWLRDCAENHVFNRVEDVDIDDEVLSPQEASTKKLTERAKPSAWLFSSIVSSVMRLPSSLAGLTQGQCQSETIEDDGSKENSHSHSLLKRCASIAGSLVRTKSLVDDEQLQSMKRKRTNTLGSGCILNATVSPSAADGSASLAAGAATSSKRIRIQGRKPIDRMRLNSDSSFKTQKH